LPDSAQPTPASYAELLALDEANRMRLLPCARPATRRASPADRETLAWLAGARCALSSQVHRRVNPQRSLTVTQRLLKSLADGGLIARFQLHREDGGGIPMGCAVTEAAIELLAVTGRSAPELCEAALEHLRADVHVVGWLLALEAAAGDAVIEVLGPGRAAIVPGVREPKGLEPGAQLRIRDLLHSAPDGSRTPVERFVPLRPSAAVSLRSVDMRPGGDLLIVADSGGSSALLETCDHLLSGWWRSVERFRRAGGPPAVVVICADRALALAQVGLADRLLSGCLAQIGVPPQQWARPGRAGIHFVAEEDLHRGLLTAWRVPALPPPLRGDGLCTPLAVEFAQLPPVVNHDAAKPPWH
jgi:protein involved in plasmid replication-relaxation